MSSLQEIAEVLRRSSRLLLCGHVVPDGDCLGSVAALGIVLEKMGKKVTMASPDPLPETLLFLPGADRFLTNCPSEEDYDTFVALDCSVPERLGAFRRCLDLDLQVINIDHHLNASSFGRHNYLDPGAAATGEILMDLIDLMGTGLERDVATCLYVAIATDTGSFRYENTSPETFRRAARLMEAGIPASAINVRLYEEKPLQTVQVLGAALEKLRISPCGKVAWVVVERELLARFSAGDEHTDGLVNFVRTIKGVEVAILFRELDPGRYKVGFRSKGEVDVHRLAARLGGGGHARASGCVISGDLTQVIENVVRETLRDVSGAGSQ
ncbi:MAG: bifunctional oligoribonuclease/PAP phosphatase NrnA [Peptococcaceae bacterium]|nr:bifunctional oligoribonuclease/PAP phosphatase NrnA [Peptococcaceae bacterium]